MTPRKNEIPIVGIGTSNGGLKVLKYFLNEAPEKTGIAFVLVQHLSLDVKSNTPELLKQVSSVPVRIIRDGLSYKANRFYLCPAGYFLNIIDGKFYIKQFDNKLDATKVIDQFFISLAAYRKDKTLAVVLSGSGSDGLAGSRKIKQAGGSVFVQSTETSEYPEMPEAIISNELADKILPPEDILNAILRNLLQADLHLKRKQKKLDNFDQYLGEIFIYLTKHTGRDFSKYKMGTIRRRLERRLVSAKIDNLPDYIDLLKKDKREAFVLQNELLISVTSFFRDPLIFEDLTGKIIPKIIKSNQNGLVRIWIPACATGEEAYTIAMILQNYLDLNKIDAQFQIFSSDIDLEAIDKAREGVYPLEIAKNVPEQYLKLYFKQEKDFYRIKEKIRNTIIFAEQNVLQDPPYSNMDLISCRNLLIYLNNELQEQVLTTFHYSLKSKGYLLLGNSESLGKSASFFSSVNRKIKLFQKVDNVINSARYWSFSNSKIYDKTSNMKQTFSQQIQLPELVKEIVLERFSPSCMIINPNSDILYIHGKPSSFLEFPSGVATLNILNSILEELKAPLGTTIRRAKKTGKEVIKRNVKINTGGTSSRIDIIVSPVIHDGNITDMLLVTFEESCSIPPAKDSLITSESEQISELEKELKETQDYLQSTIEELETTNEELKAANEEEQSTNEELQSANEELETSKEELQAVNEELINTNQELQNKIDELSKANNDILNLFSSTQIATVFLDKELKISRFTPSISTIIDLMPNDVGRPVTQFTNKLEYKSLVEDIKEVLQTLITKEVEVKTPDDRCFWMRINPYRTTNGSIEGVCVTFTDISEKKNQEEELILYKNHLEDLVEERTSELVESYKELDIEKDKARQYLDIAAVIIISLDNNGHLTLANKRASEVLGYSQNELIGKEWFNHFIPEEIEDEIRSRFKLAVNSPNNQFAHHENEIVTKDGNRRMIAWYNVFIRDEKGKVTSVLSSGEDITERRIALDSLKESEFNLRIAQSAGNIGMWVYDIKNKSIRTTEILKEIYGFDSTELVMDDLMNVIPEAEKKDIGTIFTNVIEKGGFYEVEHKIIHQKTNEIKWMRASGELVYDEEGNPQKLIGTSLDITTRKKAEEKLIRSEKMYKTLFANTGAATCTFNHNKIISMCNSEFAELCALPEEDIIGKKKWSDFISPVDLKRIEGYHTRRSYGDMDVPTEYDFEFINSKGEIKNIFLKITVDKDTGDRIASLLNITDRVKAEKAIIESEDKFKGIFEYSNTGIIIRDKDGHIMDVNDEFVDILGYPKEKLLQMNYAEFTHPNDLKSEFIFQEELIEGKRNNYRIEKRYINSNQEIIWIDISVAARRDRKGKIDLLIGMVKDMTQRKKYQEELIVQNKFIQTVLDNLPIGVATHSVNDGISNYMNTKFEEIYGWPSTEIAGINEFFKKVYPDKEYRHQIRTKVMADIKSGDASRMHWEDIMITRSDGSNRIINAINIPLSEQDIMISTVVDITDLKETQERLIKAKEEAERANNLKSAFLANTSHEIRTPLNGIIGFTDLLYEEISLTPRNELYLNVIKNSGHQLLAIIGDIIDISKIDTDQMTLQEEVVNLDNLMEEVHHFHSHSKLYSEKENMELCLKRSKKNIFVKADFARLRQILDNLITNALKYTDKGYVEFGYHIKKSAIQLFVIDTGQGIKKGQEENIFGRFVKLGSKAGTGLGLSIVKGLVELMHGEISLESKEGQGTSFRISFPFTIQKVPSSSEDKDIDRLSGELNLAGKTILVAEDDYSSYFLIEEFLSETKARVVHVQTGEEVLEYLKHEKPKLILMDVNMPVMDGLEATRLVREIDDTIPIIAQTAYAMENEKLRCFEAGCDDYISKPLNKAVLLKKIEKHM